MGIQNYESEQILCAALLYSCGIDEDTINAETGVSKAYARRPSTHHRYGIYNNSVLRFLFSESNSHFTVRNSLFIWLRKNRCDFSGCSLDYIKEAIEEDIPEPVLRLVGSEFDEELQYMVEDFNLEQLVKPSSGLDYFVADFVGISDAYHVATEVLSSTLKQRLTDNGPYGMNSIRRDSRDHLAAGLKNGAMGITFFKRRLILGTLREKLTETQYNVIECMYNHPGEARSKREVGKMLHFTGEWIGVVLDDVHEVIRGDYMTRKTLQIFSGFYTDCQVAQKIQEIREDNGEVPF